MQIRARSLRTLRHGSRLASYQIVGLIGSGGMGEVYRARDTRLHRDVALKVLPSFSAPDMDRQAQFRREARILACLNHPNIVMIYGLEQTDGVVALVLELVDGPTLADRIAAGPIPTEDTLYVAQQIAEALAAAHMRGIVHCDLKPANIKLKRDGSVKVLDFGIAKLIDRPATTADLRGVDRRRPHGSRTATTACTRTPQSLMSTSLTGAGVVLGTAPYMSPEQIKGVTADERSDLWAFGCVLFEMLTGKRAFDREDAIGTLAAVVASDPDWTALPSGLPEPIRLLLRRSLEKDRRNRLSHIAIVRFLLREALVSLPEAV